MSLGKGNQVLVTDDCTASTSNSASTPYSILTSGQKNIILFLISFAATFSPLSSFIFFPAIDALSKSLHVSVGKINLTITSYLIVAGIAPAILGDLADKTGRRIVYIGMLSIYCAANIGLAMQTSWAALFTLRMLQSCGSAATIALGYGVVSDIAPPSERGAYISRMVLGPNFATAVGPIIGGALAGYRSWRWIFWLLTLLSGTCIFLLAFFLPETARSIVGNGSENVSGFHRCIPSHLQKRGSSPPPCQLNDLTKVKTSPKRQIRLPNPFLSLTLLWAKDSAIITLIFGIFYMNLSSLQTSTSTIFITTYGISKVQTGLVYLPSGIGSCIGAYGTGFLLDHDYRVTARKHNITINALSGDDLTDFPIEKARFRSIWYAIIAAGSCMMAYGWTLHFNLNMAVPLILHFIIGLSTAVIFNMCGTLLVDVHPKSPSTAQAANSIVRAFLAGGGTALVQISLDHIGVGWTFTLFGAICMVCLYLAWLEWTSGKSWRDKLREKGVAR